VLTTSFRVSEEAITPEATLADLDLDSLDVVELSMLLQRELGARISDGELVELPNIEAIVRFLEDRTATAS
jgi:acyl carrier protein